MMSRLPLLNFLSVLVGNVLAATGPASSQSLDEIWNGALANLSSIAPTGNVELGYQNFDHCCRFAVRESLEVVDGSIVFAPGQTHLVGTVDEVLANPNPCAFSYSGNGLGYPPQIYVTYPWCATTCPGWEMTRSGVSSLSQWLQPLILFIVPSAVFCLNIPRARRLNVSRHLFPRKFSNVASLLSLSAKIPAAALVVTVDMISWTMFSMVFAGPMILSATYEAMLDRRLVNYLRRKISTNSLTVRHRAHLLCILVFGSVSDAAAWSQCISLVDGLPTDNLRRQMSSVQADGSLASPQSMASSSGGAADAADPGNPFFERREKRKQVPATYTARERSAIDVVKAKLLASLENQLSFGTAAGAGIIFYCGNFSYTLIELNANYGNVVVAHQLAFAMAWTIIPHISIVCSMLLGCNNPFIWKSALATLPAPVPFSSRGPALLNDADGDADDDAEGKGQGGKLPENHVASRKSAWFWSSVYSFYYETDTRCAWIWDRGQQKRTWIRRFAAEYKPLEPSIRRCILVDNIWTVIFFTLPPTLLLICVPCFLGAMISYTTPAVGLSCRSITILTYACAQCALVLLWAVRMFHEKDRAINYSHQGYKNRVKRLYRIRRLLWTAALALNIFISFMAGMMGTIFVFLNLYTNCFCAFPAVYWSTRWSNPDATIYLSGASYEQIYNSKAYWIPAGVTAICLLITMSWLGWWYSRLMRTQFKECASAIDAVDTEDLVENEMPNEGKG